MSLKIKKFLPYSRQNIGKTDIKAILNVLNDDYLTQGPRIETFEKNFANYVGSKHAVACATGTAALHISMLALGMNKNHNLITSPITFLASANCIQFLGGNTFFSDIDEKTICLCPNELEIVIPGIDGKSCVFSVALRSKSSTSSTLSRFVYHAISR